MRGSVLIRQISAWPKVEFDWQNGGTENKGKNAGRELVSFYVTAEANRVRGFGFGAVYAINDPDNGLFQ